jgi:uncharacterized membrane protein YfcA
MRALVLAVSRLVIKAAVVLAVVGLVLIGAGVLAGVAGIGGGPGAVVALLLVVGFVTLVRREVRQVRRGR